MECADILIRKQEVQCQWESLEGMKKPQKLVKPDNVSSRGCYRRPGECLGPCSEAVSEDKKRWHRAQRGHCDGVVYLRRATAPGFTPYRQGDCNEDGIETVEDEEPKGDACETAWKAKVSPPQQTIPEDEEHHGHDHQKV